MPLIAEERVIQLVTEVLRVSYETQDNSYEFRVT